MTWEKIIKSSSIKDTKDYRQCPECGSLDFKHSVKNIEEKPSTIKFNCLKCKNEWEEKIQ